MRPWHGKLFFLAGFVLCVLTLSSWHTSKSGECHHLVVPVWMAPKLFGLDISHLIIKLTLFLLYVCQFL